MTVLPITLLYRDRSVQAILQPGWPLDDAFRFVVEEDGPGAGAEIGVVEG